MDGHLTFCIQLVEAAVLGGIIGLERELAGKPAGLRTNLLICVGAALLTHISLVLASGPDHSDPTRIAAQIVSGIGFLGAGAIIQSRQAVHGLTSAATIWVVAGLGMAVGAGVLHDAVLGTLIVLLALIVLGRVEKRFLGQRTLTMTFRHAGRVPSLETLVENVRPRRRLLWTEWEMPTGESGRLTLAWKGRVADVESLVASIESLGAVKLETWKVDD